MTWFLDLRAQSSGGGLAHDVIVYNQNPSPWSSLAALKNDIGGRDILVVTHGFNVDRDYGRNCLFLWEGMLTLPGNVAYLGVLWPGDSSWLHGLDYPVEGGEAKGSGMMLGDFLAENFPAASLYFASHSLGARVVLEAIRRIGGRLPVRHVMLMAGAIDDTCLTDAYQDAAQKADKISVLSSFRDDVLAWAFPLGNLFEGILDRGSPYMHAALGREGPRDTLGGKVDGPWHIPDKWGYGHGNYLPKDPCQDPKLPLPQTVPAVDGNSPWKFPQWQQAWSAAMLCSRFWPNGAG